MKMILKKQFLGKYNPVQEAKLPTHIAYNQ